MSEKIKIFKSYEAQVRKVNGEQEPVLAVGFVVVHKWGMKDGDYHQQRNAEIPLSNFAELHTDRYMERIAVPDGLVVAEGAMLMIHSACQNEEGIQWLWSERTAGDIFDALRRQSAA